MSLLAALEHPPIRREAFLRHCKSEPAIGSPERDWASNGWPVHELADRLAQGAKHGRAAPGWSSAQGPDGKLVLLSEIPCGSGFVQLAIDPDSGACAFKSLHQTLQCQSFEEAAKLLARATHQDSALGRRVDPVSNSFWQGQAAKALEEIDPGRAVFHPKRGADPVQAWQDDFDAIDDHCQGASNSVAEMERVRAHYMGAASAQSEAWLRQDLKGPSVEIAGQKTRLMALGAQGAQIRAAIGLKPSGAIDPDTPVVAALGSLGPEGWRASNPADEPMRFYNFAAFAAFCASAQTLDVATPDGPDLASRLSARRSAPAQPQPRARVPS